MLNNKLAGLVLGILLFSPLAVMAKGAEFKFESFVIGVSGVDELATVVVSLHGVDLPLIVNGDTEIRSGGDEIDIEDLSIDDFVKVDAFFSAEGIVAEEISVLDERGEQFRLSGRLTGNTELDGNTFLELLGLEVRVDDSANITRRNVGSGNSVPASELVAGDEVNVRGLFENDELLATHIHVGSREQGGIELEGEVSDLTDGSFKLNLSSGGKLVVVFDENTEISGELADGILVELEGRFAENLSILAFELVVDEDGDGDADDDNRRKGRGRGNRNGNGNGNGNGNSDDNSDNDADSDDGESLVVSREAKLKADGTDVSGKAEVKYQEEGSELEQEVEVEIEDALADTDYSILVFFVGSDTGIDFGTLTTDEFGSAKAEFKTDADDDDEQDLTALLAEGSDVRDISVIQILLDGDLVVEGEL